MEKEKLVVRAGESPLTPLGGGCARRVLCYDAQMMAAEVHCETGGIGSAHRHPHAQISYILSGTFRYTVDGADSVLTAGDSIALPPNCLHGTECLEKGVLLDVFSPAREDFVQEKPV